MSKNFLQLEAMLIAISLLAIMLPSVLSSDVLYTYCGKGNYTLNDSFETNLRQVLDDISSNIMRDGNFPALYNSSTDGDVRGEVYGQALCRGDVIDSATCQHCVKAASNDILQNCKRKDAVIWYDLCQVRYSFQKFFTLTTYTGKYPEKDRLKKIIRSENQAQFRQVLDDLMGGLINHSAFTPAKRMFATGEARVFQNDMIYGLVQCTRDISEGSCSECLGNALGDLNACCSVRLGGFVVSRSCTVRFELYRFYNDTSKLYPLPKVNKWGTPKIVAAIFAPASVLAILLCSCALYISRKNRRDDHGRSEEALLRQLASHTSVSITEEGQLETCEELPFVDLSTVREATQDFATSNKLGQGGFGTVYKGVLPDGKEVAVKRLSRKSSQGLEEFKNEVILIAKLQHRNLTRLVGWSFEGEEKLLLYEFMPNRSLDFFIFDEERRREVDWEVWYNIISGIAKGVVYLHEDSRLKIIHRDLKPSNVLLDLQMTAKISDFGVARIFSHNQTTHNTKRVVGTLGYMAPEYAMGGIFSVKSDVFSFGVILLEILNGNKNSGFHLINSQSLLSYAWGLWREERACEFLHPTMMKRNGRIEEARRLIHIGLLCVQEDPEDRPTMRGVVELLPRSGLESLLSQPKEPPFSAHSSLAQPDLTVNGLTISDILPR